MLPTPRAALGGPGAIGHYVSERGLCTARWTPYRNGTLRTTVEAAERKPKRQFGQGAAFRPQGLAGFESLPAPPDRNRHTS